ncbi:MAG: polysaccharide deacetylase family protein [Fimbriimonadaceae bacterium]
MEKAPQRGAELTHSITAVKRVSNRPGNRKGTVLVLMYHRTGPDEKYMVRSQKNFLADLTRLYRLGYRPVTLAEYGANDMMLPRGASPVILTFDDSDPSQFQLRADGSIDPASMVGIWHKFAKSHPQFPVKGTFFVLPNGPWGKAKDAPKKLKYMKKWGCEIGSHTMRHKNLSKLTDEEVTTEFGKSFEYVAKLGFEPTSMALPYGILPKNRELVRSFVYNGHEYRYWNVVLAGSSPAKSPMNKTYDNLRIQRVQAYDGIYGINWWLDFNKKNPTHPYVQP